MIQNLTPLGVSVPGGFGVSSSAYDAVLDRFELRERLELLLKDVDVNDLEDLAGKCVALSFYDNQNICCVFGTQSLTFV
jgi:phosphoenolpyruvate synthase/pyruvate phosphate dikinase